MTKNMKKGFTLVEMMIVVAIIAVLAGVAMPQYTKYVKKSETVEGVRFMKQIIDAEEIYRATNTGYVEFNTKTGTEAADVLDELLGITIPTGALFLNYKVEECTTANGGGIMVSSWIGNAADAATNATSIYMVFPKRTTGSSFIKNYTDGLSAAANVPACQ